MNRTQLLKKVLELAEDIRDTIEQKDLTDQYKMGYCAAEIREIIKLLRLYLGS